MTTTGRASGAVLRHARRVVVPAGVVQDPAVFPPGRGCEEDRGSALRPPP
ncbi:hypothetical protein [Cellulosimicrobium funkei]